MRVNGKVAVVTGAGSGIGRASARALSREGARVVVVDLNGDAARETCELIQSSGGTAVSCHADISTAEGADEMISRAVLEFGSLDILHNNAGIAVRQPHAQYGARLCTLRHPGQLYWPGVRADATD
ncbi:MAG TPA: SDR family NAD(P)-dependent oxidoreductase [Blastocatellia bacterium]|nr:SDR family NAD(P)-dependent oxidoreductase [Blastocatellia bacterium]